MFPTHLLSDCINRLSAHLQGPVPIIAYHEIGGDAEYPGGPRYDIHGINISVAAFRRQLEIMYANGFRPVNTCDLILRRLDLPRGKRPIVLTFDDGRATQFRYLANGRVDPQCAVGVMLAFHHDHPDWPLRGSFYLIAGSDLNGVPFDQEGLERLKVRQLLDWGFEIGNHSLTHPSFRFLRRRQIVPEVAGCDAYLKKLVPGIDVQTLALPYGQLPVNSRSLPALVESKSNSERYRNIGVLLFGGGLCPSPYSSQFDPYKIPRIGPKPGYVESILIKLSR